MVRSIHTSKHYYEFLGNLQRLEKKCFVCGTTLEVEPHHIRKVKKSNSQYGDESNIVMLCHKHHVKYHQRYKNVNQKTFAVFVGEEKDKIIRKQSHKINVLNSRIRKLEKSLAKKNNE